MGLRDRVVLVSIRRNYLLPACRTAGSTLLHHANPSHSRSVGYRILATVAEKEGVDAWDLETPLYDVIDPDAMEALFRDGRGTVTFEYLDYVVTVDHEHAVEVAPREAK